MTLNVTLTLTLTHRYLDSNQLTDKGALALAEGISANKANDGLFVSMDYDTNHMTAAGEAAIAQAIHEAGKMGGDLRPAPNKKGLLKLVCC